MAMEILEFHCIRAARFGKMDEAFCPFEVAVVVGADFRNEVRGVAVAYPLISDSNLRHFRLPLCEVSSI
jgi:hypothetical protein